MKAISLWQPWASAIAVGAKTIETRGWCTDYRGPLAIHAAKRVCRRELIYYYSCWNWKGVFYHHLLNNVKLWDALPFGAIIAVTDLVDCRLTDTINASELYTPRRPKGVATELLNWTEAELGDFSLGRYGWILSNVRALPKPVPFAGKQRFFNVPDDLLREAA